MDNHTLAATIVGTSVVAGLLSAFVIARVDGGRTVPVSLSMTRYATWAGLGAFCVMAVQRYLSA